MFEAIIKVNVADDRNRRARDIEDGIGYACSLLMDEYGLTAEYIASMLERITDEVADEEEAMRS